MTATSPCTVRAAPAIRKWVSPSCAVTITSRTLPLPKIQYLADTRLAARLGCSPTRRHYSGIGGTTPQVLVQEAATRIIRGESDVALVVGAEALVRWTHAIRGVVQPAQFVRVAEDTGLIVPIGNWIIEEGIPLDRTDVRLNLVEQMAGVTRSAQSLAKYWCERIFGIAGVDANTSPYYNVFVEARNFMAQGSVFAIVLADKDVEERSPRMVEIIIQSPDFQWR